MIKINSNAFRNSSFYYMQEKEDVVTDIEQFLSDASVQPPNKIFEVFFALSDLFLTWFLLLLLLFLFFCCFFLFFVCSPELLLMQNTEQNAKKQMSRLLLKANIYYKESKS